MHSDDCVLCSFERCHSCHTGTDVEPVIFATVAGTLTLTMCDYCEERPSRWPVPGGVVRLSPSRGTTTGGTGR